MLRPAPTLMLSMLALSFTTQARAEDRHERHEEKREVRQEVRRDVRQDVRHDEHLPPRPPAPTWRAHPPGVRPNYAPVRPHAVRVLRPHVAAYGQHPWRHWTHVEFVRPAYYWEWNLIHNVSCVAEDSYGDQYPVSESTFAGFGLDNMTAVEDDALDRCYAESNGDPNCFLISCSHY